MNRIVAFAIIAAGLLGVGVVLATSESAAEPILGEESLSLPPPTAEKEATTDALSLFKAHDFEGALKLWREAAQNNADLPPAQVIMAQLYFQAGMLKEAQVALDQAASDDPADPETYLLMAMLAMHDHDASKAEVLIQKAQRLLATFTKSAKRKQQLQSHIWSSLAAVAEARGDWAGAQKVLEGWLKRDPKNVEVMHRIAYDLLQQKNAEGALAKLREAAKADPKSLPPETLMAQLYRQAGDRENADKWMATALAAAPKDLKTRLAAGYRALELGQMDEAQKNAVAAAQIDPKSRDAKFLRGLIALCQKDYTAGELFFESILQKSPNDFAASNNLALALVGEDDEPKSRRALEYAEANAQKLPTSSNAASTYGWVLYKLGRLDDAEKALHTAAALGKVSVDTAYFTARVEVDRGHKAEAKEVLESALKETGGLLMFRHEAEELLEQLKK